MMTVLLLLVVVVDDYVWKIATMPTSLQCCITPGEAVGTIAQSVFFAVFFY